MSESLSPVLFELVLWRVDTFYTIAFFRAGPRLASGYMRAAMRRVPGPYSSRPSAQDAARERDEQQRAHVTFVRRILRSALDFAPGWMAAHSENFDAASLPELELYLVRRQTPRRSRTRILRFSPRVCRGEGGPGYAI